MNEKQIQLLKFLRFGALVVLVTGLLPSLAVFQVTQEPWRLFFDVLSWPYDNMPGDFSATERQISAVLGGVLCGWSLLLYKLADPDIFNEKIRSMMIQSVWIWFIVDSAGSVLAGLPLNAISNMGFLLILLIPLHRLRPKK